MFKSLSLISLLLITGCATTESYYDKIVIPEPLELTLTEPYKQDISTLENIIVDSINIKPLYAKYNTDKTISFVDDISQAQLVVLTPEEFEKFANLAETANGLSDVVRAQSTLVNQHIQNINELKELAKLERYKLILTTTQWQNSELLLDKEINLRNRENILHEVRFYGMLAGLGLVVLGL